MADQTITILDICYTTESVSLNANLSENDSCQCTEMATILANLKENDTAKGFDFNSLAQPFFFIDSRNVLQPLGVFIMRDGTKEDLLPATRENAESVPGRHGEFDFGSELEARVWEFKVHNNTTPAEKAALKRTLAAYLNPLLGEKPFIDSHDIEKTYYIKYAGKIPLDNYVNALQFTIPFKASDPIACSSFEQVRVGSGTITNDGTLECPLTIEIVGAATNPSVTIGSYTLTYTGTLTSSDTLIIDTGALTCTFNGTNALGNLTGLSPDVVLAIGDTSVAAANTGISTFRWREHWI